MKNIKIIHQRKIKAIYNNDGPGFLKEQVNSKEYKKIAATKGINNIEYR